MAAHLQKNGCFLCMFIFIIWTGPINSMGIDTKIRQKRIYIRRPMCLIKIPVRVEAVFVSRYSQYYSGTCMETLYPGEVEVQILN